MKPYQPRTPRAAFGVVAAAMATLTLGALVVLPAKVEAVSDEAGASAAVAERECHATREPSNSPRRTNG